ncbi:MAG: hypothetical protein Q9167_007330 [Letrouitia subvulpina]
MATGIEVLGLTLAVFPVVVEGLKSLKEGIDTVKSFKSYRYELANYFRMIKTASVYFLDTIEDLLDGIVETQDELDKLRKDPGGTAWNKPYYEERLRKRLDHDYDIYLENMHIMKNALQTIIDRLGLNTTAESILISWEDSPTWQRQLKKLKLAMMRKNYKEQLAEIDKANKDLRECTQQSRRLEPGRRKRQSYRKAVDFKSIRRHAGSLYSIFIQSSFWNCRCRNQHTVNLRLEPRPWHENAGALNTENVNTKGVLPIRFQILLSRGREKEDQEETSVWHKVDIEPIEILGLPVEEVKYQASPLHNLERLTPISTNNSHVSKKTVTFSADDATLISQATQLTLENASGASSPKLITDICSTISYSTTIAQNIGFLVDEKLPSHQYSVRCIDQFGAIARSESLESILCISQGGVPGQILSWRDRLTIAVTLASSVLQLDGTPWLSTYWRSADIFFLPTKKSSSMTLPIDITHPYLSQTIPSEEPSIKKNREENKTLARYIRNDILFALSVTLVELCFGQAISVLRTTEDIDLTEVATNFNTVSRLMYCIYLERGDRYGDVVRRCLECPFDTRQKTFDNEQFQNAVFDSIVIPLQQQLEDFGGSVRTG